MSPSNSENPAATSASRKLFPLLCLLLALGTMALYWPITHYPFVQFDDDQYVVANPHVNSGLSATNFVWAFTTSEQANWHPLTWVSLQTDCALLGVNPGGTHLVNLLFHIANTLLLFLFLRSATGAVWRSAVVAALFAWHPMHVESVAWAAERKDVLSTFFWMLALLAYLQYARSVPRRAWPFYVLTLCFCACGLMSKPMVVTLPCALLLLDFWPLNRIAPLQSESGLPEPMQCQPVSLIRVVLEKVPFFALIVAGSVVTYLVQSGSGAVSGIALSERLSNAALAYSQYTAKMFWPTDLAIIYPHPRHWPVPLALGAAALLAVWTCLCAFNWRRSPYLAVGWFWFLGTLVPTIGIIQVGAQAMADRYTYIPSIGLFIVVVWGAAAFFRSRASGRVILPALGCAALTGCAGATICQLDFWRDSIVLFRHAIEVTTDNYAAENCLGKAYERRGTPGDDARALACYELSVKTEPRFPYAQFNLAMALLDAGQVPEALGHLQRAAALEPRDPDIQYDLGIYFSQHNSWTNAMLCFSNSLAVRPDFAPTQMAMGSALAHLKHTGEAAAHFKKALELDPKLLQARTNLDRLRGESR
jgi:tetratricopeptide (TPR) repeat protein